MDPFRTLTGGSRFDQQRFKSDIAHFDAKLGASAAASTSVLPSELDFFGAGLTSEANDKERRKQEKKSAKKRARELERTDEVPIDFPLLLRQHRIKLTGIDSPNPIPTFNHLLTLAISVSTSSKKQAERMVLLESNWTNHLKLNEPTAVQMTAWGILLADRDALVCAPTGSGKTLAFILPLLMLHAPRSSLSPVAPSTSTPPKKVLKPTSLILEPTRELAMQVFREVSELARGGGWSCVVLGEEERVKKIELEKEKKANKSKGKKGGTAVAVEEVAEPELDDDAEEDHTDILITTPLRLIFAIQSGAVDLSSVLHLILDESDKLFELNFIEQTDEIIAACSNPAIRKGMFSATMSSTVEDIAKGVMGGGAVGMVRAIIGQKDSATSTITQSLQFVGTEEHKLLALRTLITSGQFTPPVLIFVQSILRAKELAAELLFDGINADCIHADRTPEERDAAVLGFERGSVWCLISTDIMARGVDFKEVKLVVNYDFPQSAGSYIHRIGRTGRAGKSGKAVTFFTKDDAPHLKSIVNVMRTSGCEVPQFMVDMPNPSQRLKKTLSLHPVNRQDVRQTNGAGMTKVGGKRKVERERVMGGPVREKKKSKKGKEEIGMNE